MSARILARIPLGAILLVAALLVLRPWGPTNDVEQFLAGTCLALAAGGLGSIVRHCAHLIATEPEPEEARP